MPDPIQADFVLDLMPDLRDALREAASLALPSFRAGGHTAARIWSKAGGSPVTEADVAVDTFLKVRLGQIVPAAAWLSEETADDPVRLGHDLVWIVDPIDGTRAFLSGHPDWSIAVALLKAGEPVVGFVHAPALGQDYEAVRGRGATCNGRIIGTAPGRDLATARVTGPKPMFDRLERGVSRAGAEAAFTRVARVPSLALRVARVADGSIDVGLVSSDARDWDLAAADLILREAGGSVCDLRGVATVYNRPDPVHGELVAVGHALRDAVVSAWSRGG
ncbi:3'(2'),5'-bisphosphate nucleotidase CysQ [uncultured Methylobacterium sp.]|uniref:3'(2'),5'-bisphosphate nucleotidase CysQ n=1 Tax=uncultured Methylobacterium sp. TaxID=157278 RepID=UPI0035CADDF2